MFQSLALLATAATMNATVYLADMPRVEYIEADKVKVIIIKCIRPVKVKKILN